jgi:hypothetical protein
MTEYINFRKNDSNKSMKIKTPNRNRIGAFNQVIMF